MLFVISSKRTPPPPHTHNACKYLESFFGESLLADEYRRTREDKGQ